MRATWLFISAALLLPQAVAHGAVDIAYLTELIEKSRQLRLAERPEWRKLLHYVPNLATPGVHGLVDSPQFYNSPQGKFDPRAELEATLASFYSDVEETSERQNPQCAFIARYTWLDAQLSFDPTRLPRQPCDRYRQWHAALNPHGLTLIFASAYLNNPSSMYGHTLVRVDARDQDDRTRLLAYAINFAANTDETNGIAFAINGLFGGYPGAFSILPYYLKVREYSDLENRDIWEYELNFTREEVDRVLMHAWELGPIYFQYFFFDENCSYHLLGLLQVARPELDLTGSFRWWALPSDTLRAVTRNPELVKRAVYRPANATIIGHRLGRMTEAERKIVKELSLRRAAADDPVLRALPGDRKAAVLEVSHDYVNYRRATGSKDVSDPSALSRELLVARSQLEAAAQAPDVPVPAVKPDEGHGSSRVSVGAGRREHRNFQELSARATYHDIMDTDGGYIRGAQIEFFSIAFRRYESESTRLERFTPIDILSLTPRDDFFQSMSWKIAAGWQRARTREGGEPLVFALDGGAGRAWSSGREGALLYALLDASARFDGELEDEHALGAGFSLGALVDLSPRWRVHGYARSLRYFLGQRDTPAAIGLEQRVALGRDLALRLDIARNRELDRAYNVGSASVLMYF